MRPLFASLFLLICSTPVLSQTENIVIGKRTTLHSTILNEERRIWVYSPTTTAYHVDSTKKYPVLYVLDGDAHFFGTVGIIQELSQANGNGVLPEMMVVGIENSNRLRDLTPSTNAAKTIEQANPFLQFLSKELIPFIDKNYSTAPYRILAGHSLGGLTAIDILTNFPQLFNAYIAIDPSMWFKDQFYLKNTLTTLGSKKLNGTRLFMGIANTMSPNMKRAALATDQSAETIHVRSIFKLDQFLTNIKNGLVYSQVFYEKEKHNTVPLISMYDGLKSIFHYYQLDLTEKDLVDTSSRLASILRKHYANVSEQLGYKVAAPEALVNYWAYEALGKNQINKSESLFKLNIDHYPNSFGAYNAYSDLLLAKKDTAGAILLLQKSMNIKTDSSTIKKLNALTQPQLVISVDDLKNYEGIYTLENFNLDISLEIRNGKLFAKVPGQVEEEFLPISKDQFTVKGKQGYHISFKMDGNKPIEFVSVQPNGRFKAVFKKK